MTKYLIYYKINENGISKWKQANAFFETKDKAEEYIDSLKLTIPTEFKINKAQVWTVRSFTRMP